MTTSNTQIVVTIPLRKPLEDSITSSDFSVTILKIELRQNGSYLATSMDGIEADIYTNTKDFCRLLLNKSGKFGGTNNDTVGIMVGGKIKIS